jgi:DNA-binding HxlR family transcriptional regulator
MRLILSSLRVTMDPAAAVPEIPGCQGRKVLGRIGDKWSFYVIHLLDGGTRRFSELRRHIGGITRRMLTVTIRSLERDGLI